MTATPKLKIAEFRRVVDSLNWSRNDLAGATPDEFVRMNVPPRLERHIGEVLALLPAVPARFAGDIEDAHKAIEHAHKCIARWVEKVAASQAQAQAALPVRPSLYLVR
jgi:hypothetical protein